MGRLTKFAVTNTQRGWLVNVPPSKSDSGKRVQRYFPTREKANEFARGLKDNHKEFGEQARTLSPGLAEDAISALALLNDFGISLTACARFYALHHDLRTKAPTVAQAWQRAMTLRKKLSARYCATLKGWQKRLPEDFSTKNIVDLTPAHISDALTTMTDGATAWKSGLRVISAVLGDEVKQGTLAANPCSRVSTPKIRNDDEVTLYTVDQLKALFAACKPYDKGKDRNCGTCAIPFAFLAFAGIRPTELTRLSWDDVSLPLLGIRLGGKVTKTGATRNVRINPTLKAWIESIPESQRTGKVIPGRWTQKATRVRREAGLDGRELQDALRHSYASYMLATETDDNALKLDMGHQHWAVFFNHYHNAMTSEQAAPYWKVLPPKKQRLPKKKAASRLDIQDSMV